MLSLPWSGLCLSSVSVSVYRIRVVRTLPWLCTNKSRRDGFRGFLAGPFGTLLISTSIARHVNFILLTALLAASFSGSFD